MQGFLTKSKQAKNMCNTGFRVWGATVPFPFPIRYQRSSSSIVSSSSSPSSVAVPLLISLFLSRSAANKQACRSCNDSPESRQISCKKNLAAASRLEALNINQVKRAEFVVVVVVPLLLSLEVAIFAVTKEMSRNTYLSESAQIGAHPLAFIIVKITKKATNEERRYQNDLKRASGANRAGVQISTFPNRGGFETHSSRH